MNTERNHRWLLWTIVLAAAICDLGAKYIVFGMLQDDREHQSEFVLVPGAFKLLAQYTNERDATPGLLGHLRQLTGDHLPHVNHGALFSLGNQHRLAANAFFALVSGLAALAIVVWSFRPEAAADRTLCIALGLILGGTLGNFYDRIVFFGVRDFLYFHWFEFPVFNLADCCLVGGASLLMMQAFWQPRSVPTMKCPSITDGCQHPWLGKPCS